LITVFGLRGLFEHFDDTVMLYVAFVSFANEAIEVGSCRAVGGSGVPKVLFFVDVGGMEDSRPPFVVDVELVDRVGKSFDEVLDDEFVVDAVGIGGDHVGEFNLVVDDKNGVLDGVAAEDVPTAGTVVVGEGYEADGVVA
jgi:hypothetical protein